MSKLYELIETTITINKVKSVLCDCCKKELDPEQDIFDIQDMIHIEHLGGYGSVFGDGTRVTADFCAECSKTLFGNFIQTDNMWEDVEEI